MESFHKVSNKTCNIALLNPPQRKFVRRGAEQVPPLSVSVTMVTLIGFNLQKKGDRSPPVNKYNLCCKKVEI